MSHRDDLLAQLPPAAAAAIHAAGRVAEHNEKVDALEAAWEAVGGGPRCYGEVVFSLPSELPPVQRAFAELCAIENLPHDAPMPSGDVLRRWLGLEPPGVLEESVTVGGRHAPVWRLLQEKVPAAEVLAQLSTEKQLALLSAYAGEVWAYRISLDRALAWRSSVTETLRGEGEPWARATLARWTPATHHAFESGSKYRTLSLAQGTTNLAFFALVRAGVEIDPKWDELLPMDLSVPVSIFLECAAALPLDRLERAAMAVLESDWGPSAFEHGVALLRKVDSREIAEAVIAICSKNSPHHRKVRMTTLLEIGERQPNVKAAVLVALGKAPKPIHLQVLARSQPRAASDLSKTQAAQLVAAGKLWDGKSLPVERRLSLDENDESALGPILEHVVIGNADKKPLYEAWLYAGDSGAFFVAGKTTVIAQRIQDATTTGKPNDALCDALSAIGYSSKAVRAVADVRAATEAGAAARAAAKSSVPTAKKAKPAKASTKKATNASTKKPTKASTKKPANASTKKAAKASTKKPTPKRPTPGIKPRR